MRWIVGDIQGCFGEFEELLDEINLDPAQDELWSLGDLINRGPDSLAVLRLWHMLGGQGILGNHEVSALLSFSGTRPKRLESLERLFGAVDATELLEQLRNLPIVVYLPSTGDGPDCWIVHAGVSPSWSLPVIAGTINEPPHSDAWLQSEDVSFATSVRCCREDGSMCSHKGVPEACPPPCLPWDSFYRGETLVLHGHWAARGYYRGTRSMGLDSGCVYGGWLTAWCQEEDRIVQVRSRQPR